MKKSAYLKKGKERDLIDALGTKATLFVPCLEGEAVIFKPAEPGCTLCLSRPAVSPPKGVIYPQSETLFSFTFKKDPEDQRRTLVDLGRPDRGA